MVDMAYAEGKTNPVEARGLQLLQDVPPEIHCLRLSHQPSLVEEKT
jgi:hypothetical protein